MRVHRVRERGRIATSRTLTVPGPGPAQGLGRKPKFHRHRRPVRKAMTMTRRAEGGHAIDARLGRLFSSEYAKRLIANATTCRDAPRDHAVLATVIGLFMDIGIAPQYRVPGTCRSILFLGEVDGQMVERRADQAHFLWI